MFFQPDWKYVDFKAIGFKIDYSTRAPPTAGTEYMRFTIHGGGGASSTLAWKHHPVSKFDCEKDNICLQLEPCFFLTWKGHNIACEKDNIEKD